MTGHIFCDDKNVWKLTIKICHYKNIEFDNDNVLYILEDFCNDKHVWNLMPQHFWAVSCCGSMHVCSVWSMMKFKQGKQLYCLMILRGYTTPDILINHPRGMPINEPLCNEPYIVQSVGVWHCAGLFQRQKIMTPSQQPLVGELRVYLQATWGIVFHSTLNKIFIHLIICMNYSDLTVIELWLGRGIILK